MAAKEIDVVHVRLLSRPAQEMYEGQATEFGLQDRFRVLHAGINRADGFVAFAADLPVVYNPKTGSPRFRGPFIHNGSQGAQHLYIGWRYLNPSSPDDPWVNRLKVHLHITWDQVLAVLAADAVLETDCTGPAWGVLKNWHGLNAGREWTID